MNEERLQRISGTYQKRARVPFSRDSHVVLLLLSDGAWIPGVRIDSASFPLSIPATLNAVSTAWALDRTDVVVLWSNRSLTRAELLYAEDAFPGHSPRRHADHVLIYGKTPVPEPRTELIPTIRHSGGASRDLIPVVRTVAKRAHVPSSRFPVGCIIPVGNGLAVPGVNVEHPEWPWILCAERNALGTLVSYGLSEPDTLILSCLRDDEGTPCGACRQLIMELAPGASVWMDRGNRPPDCMEAVSMLPYFFTGRALTPD
ncbi:MAG: cytidine deaminase [Bacteroidetes bacterium CG12_big_fil_rev_8_21_14_0_65_60_17]|nr:MAG: cytidine deaminase [Bacteroidetes bacterium CG12_big_fil_rev_8_21_14_0_65_60_17]